MSHIWLRNEDKAQERRTPLVPRDAKKLVDLGHQVTIENSDMRAYSNDTYRQVGCEIAPPLSWQHAPEDAYILGLKDLGDSAFPIAHKHIYFSHSFQGQSDASQLLARFKRGGGTIYDFEYMRHQSGDRVAAFGFHAGIAACALAIFGYSAIKNNQSKFLATKWYRSDAELKAYALKALTQLNEGIDVQILGGAGRCGRGVSSMLNALGVKYTSWERNEHAHIETVRSKILEADILFNCITADADTPQFLSKHDLKQLRKLSLVVDVACDFKNPHNPLPIYGKENSFLAPLQNVAGDENPLWVISINNFASMLPIECSELFSLNMLPFYIDLLDNKINRVLAQAEKAFNQAAGCL